ncbi:hypothetical protein CFE70_007117 [Pyrenophora teres f. teres 0-1]|uniref:Uncharacterized protein n=2 Tax=Pyrenophora teres f. teres TaxID=97479 RepID=E3RQV9_PYRTT|nr:hypothetical protein PTT_11149 [Pyrenophora teres f. teres 0-1]KAE8825887.1 hypothetical protein HRS9139_08997 [Pyrenophora teres f. teres]KAE8834986.1 hypothetical protein PTNB85_06319 [Pyrenophora teres f. teres]KAE8843538.1 hypothetical protein HRS9122_04641 [Pyrenophora teres f. teres]KAE8856674.1 hypothetical protein PTNB73_09396 [Pyrenophora teres f. teres]
MGIPIGWNIRRDDAKDRDVLRDDVSGHRSPIRRRSRPTRSPRPHSTLDTDFLISASASASASDFHFVPRPSHRSRLAPPPVPEVSRTDYRTHDASREPPALQREESSLRRSRNRLDGYMRAWETRAAMDSERPLPDFTPGFAPASTSHTSEPELLRDTRDPSLMRARASYRRAIDARLTRSRSPRADPSPARGDAAISSEHGHESSGDGFPPLRRMGRRTIADGPLPASSLRESWSPVPALDGLGDRNRSVSPFGDTPLWDSFLTTVVDDPVAPTAGSSFASAAASASFSNSHSSSRAGSSNSAASSQTHVTVPSRRQSPPQNEQFMRACDTSEDDSASDTEEDMDGGSTRRRNATEALRNRLGASDPAPPRRRIRASYFSNEPPTRDTERYSLRVIDRSREASAYVRSFYSSGGAWREIETPDSLRPQNSQLDGPIEEPINNHEEEAPSLVSADAAPLDQELRDARSLLERLSRREDISDDFWASVGLIRSFADPIERLQELERL